MNTLELLKTTDFSETQISKIQKELSLFENLNYKLTECREWSYRKGTLYYYVFTKNNVDIHCHYTLLYSNRISSSFRLWDNEEERYLTDEYKTYKDFIKLF